MIGIATHERPGVGDLWLRAPRPGAGAEPPLSRARIAAGAVALLDAEGLDRLTMRRLAERLGVGTATLYWHVATKDDVIDLAVDEIFGEVALPEAHVAAREDLALLLANWRRAMLRHPWSATVPARRRPLLGPNFLGWMEFLQAALVRLGVPDGAVNAATWVLYNHVVGSAAAQSSLELTEESVRAGEAYLATLAERYPTVAEHSYITDAAWDDNFDAGLAVILDGLAARTPAPGS